MALDEATAALKPIALYLLETHPLETPNGNPFPWLGDPAAVKNELEVLIGHHDPADVSLLIDDQPGGLAWRRLLDGLLAGQVRTVVTHLAPLTSAQRQQLIGICAEMGAQLITPGDAGRNRPSD